MSDIPTLTFNTESNDDIQATGEVEAGSEDLVPVVPGRTPFCMVCSMSTMGPTSDSVLMQPCRCGYWVHDQCLINVTMNFEDLHPGTHTIGCRICGRGYNVLPFKSKFIKYAETFSDVWYQGFCYLSMKTFITIVVDITCIKVGSLALRNMYGPSEAARLVFTMSPLRAVLTCQLISMTSIAVSSIAWEHRLLKLLRKCSRLPLVGGAFPIEDRNVPDIYKDRFSWNVIGGLLLPFYAAVASRLFTGLVEDPFQRFLLGGTSFFLLKGACKMYYTQKKYVRYCRLDVVSFDHPNG